MIEENSSLTHTYAHTCAYIGMYTYNTYTIQHVKVLVLKLTYRFNTICIKIAPGSFVEIDKLVLKMYMEMQKS